MIKISDTTGQVAYVRDEYLIAVITPGLLSGGDGKCRVIFVGGVIEVTSAEAQRVIDCLRQPITPLASSVVAAATVD